MANINLILPNGESAVTGKQITFQSPCNSEDVESLVINNLVYSLVDAVGNPIRSNAFVKDAMISIIINVETKEAFIQNAASINEHTHALASYAMEDRDLTEFSHEVPYGEATVSSKSITLKDAFGTDILLKATGYVSFELTIKVDSISVEGSDGANISVSVDDKSVYSAACADETEVIKYEGFIKNGITLSTMWGTSVANFSKFEVAKYSDGFVTGEERQKLSQSEVFTAEEKEKLAGLDEGFSTDHTHPSAKHEIGDISLIGITTAENPEMATITENTLTSTSAQTFNIDYIGNVEIELSCVGRTRLIVDGKTVSTLSSTKPTETWSGEVKESLSVSATGGKTVTFTKFVGDKYTDGFMSGRQLKRLEDTHTKEESDNLYAPKTHTHIEEYAEIDHTHEYAGVYTTDISLLDLTYSKGGMVSNVSNNSVTFTGLGNITFEISGLIGFTTKPSIFAPNIFVDGTELEYEVVGTDENGAELKSFTFYGSVTSKVSITPEDSFNIGTLYFESFYEVEAREGFMSKEQAEKLAKTSANLIDGDKKYKNSLHQALDTKSWTPSNKFVKTFIADPNAKTEVEGNRVKVLPNGDVSVGVFGNNAVMFGGKSQSLGGKSFTEGSKNIVIANNGHAEGNENFVAGQHGHTEGKTNATLGNSGHSENIDNVAVGDASHVQGVGNIANGDKQNPQSVSGRYNEEDTENRYSHIVGNGEHDKDRKNSHTLDWGGNAWYREKVYVGGNNQDEGEPLITDNEAEAKFDDKRTEKKSLVVPHNDLLLGTDDLHLSLITEGDKTIFDEEFTITGRYFGYVGLKNLSKYRDGAKYCLVAEVSVTSENFEVSDIRVAGFEWDGVDANGDKSTQIRVGTLQSGRNYIVYPFTCKGNYGRQGFYMDSNTTESTVTFTLHDVRLYEMKELEESKDLITDSVLPENTIYGGNTIFPEPYGYILHEYAGKCYAVPLMDNIGDIEVHSNNTLAGAISGLQALAFAKGINYKHYGIGEKIKLKQGCMYYIYNDSNIILQFACEGIESGIINDIDGNGVGIDGRGSALLVTSNNADNGNYTNFLTHFKSTQTTHIFHTSSVSNTFWVKHHGSSVYVWEVQM